MATLATVQDYVTEARVLLLDEVAPYRYTDPTLLMALNLAMMDIRRVRPDILIAQTTTPNFSAVDTTTVSLDEMYRIAVLYFIVGFSQIKDDEETSDARAGAFLQRFSQILTVGV